jgi:hypothetical protein
MAVICHCPNCLGEVIGRFQRSCTVCGREIPVELRMAEVPVLEATPVEVRRASSLQQRVLAGVVAGPAATPFTDAEADEADADQPREMDWEDDEPVEPARRRRWFRR